MLLYFLNNNETGGKLDETEPPLCQLMDGVNKEVIYSLFEVPFAFLSTYELAYQAGKNTNNLTFTFFPSLFLNNTNNTTTKGYVYETKQLKSIFALALSNDKFVRFFFFFFFF